MESLDINEACDLVKFSNGRKPIGSNWMFKKKLNATKKFEKYKAQLVAKGYSQEKGIDSGDICSPISKMTSIRFIFPLSTTFDLEVETMDVKIVFLYGDLDKEICMKQLEIYIVRVRRS